jgi:hypothetical protein
MKFLNEDTKVKHTNITTITNVIKMPSWKAWVHIPSGSAIALRGEYFD